MKNLNSNKGFTLIELIVSIAILALLATAIIGVLNSNTVIFRKSKADLSVQNSAQETYQKLSEEIMQAKYVYIEGYTTSSDVKFPTNKVGSESGADFTSVKLLRQSDINILNLSKTYSDVKIYMDDVISAGVPEKTNPNKNKIDTFYNNIRYMKDFELEEYASFLRTLDNSSTYIPFTDSSLVTEIVSGSKTNVSYGKVYVTKIVVQYSVPFNREYCSDITKLKDPGNKEKFSSDINNVDNDQYRKDYCRATYTFYNNVMKASYKYGAMDKLNTVVSGDSDIYSKSLNYVKGKSGSSSQNVPGVVCYIDGNHDVVGLDMFFAQRSMSYTDNGMIYMRNSYVLHDSK